jgi:hypothetical protein
MWPILSTVCKYLPGQRKEHNKYLTEGSRRPGLTSKSVLRRTRRMRVTYSSYVIMSLIIILLLLLLFSPLLLLLLFRQLPLFLPHPFAFGPSYTFSPVDLQLLIILYDIPFIDHVTWVPCHHGMERPRPCGMQRTACRYGGLLRIYWIRSRGQQTRGGPPPWGFAVELTTPHLRNKLVTKYHKGPRT